MYKVIIFLLVAIYFLDVGCAYATAEISSHELYSLVNQERQKKGLIAYNYSQKLEEAAYAKVQHLIEVDEWAHTASDGITPWYFIENAKYSYTYAGENLARKFITNEGTVKGWMDSESHRTNILDSNFDETGIAVFDTGEYILTVQMFAKKAIPSKELTQAPERIYSVYDRVLALLQSR